MSLISNISFLNTLSSAQALWLLWLVMLFLFIIISIIFSYQWRHYSIQNSNLRFAEFVYYIIAIFCLGFSALAIILFNTHI